MTGWLHRTLKHKGLKQRVRRHDTIGCRTRRQKDCVAFVDADPDHALLTDRASGPDFPLTTLFQWPQTAEPELPRARPTQSPGHRIQLLNTSTEIQIAQPRVGGGRLFGKEGGNAKETNIEAAVPNEQ